MSVNEQLRRQVGWHYRSMVRPRLEGLTDEEYHWEPVRGCWGLRPRAEATMTYPEGVGDWAMDYVEPEPDPAPVTTIAWRMGHLIVSCLGARTDHHFGGPPVTHETWVYAGTAAEGLAQLDAAYDAWDAGVEALGEEGLARPCGSFEGYFADNPLSDLLLHVNRELIHHGAEICLLRDLYLRRGELS